MIFHTFAWYFFACYKLIMMKDYLTTKQAAERLNVVPSRIRRMILDGVIRAEKIGRDNFISEAQIKKLETKKRKPGRPLKSENGDEKAQKPFKTAFDIAPDLLKRLQSKHQNLPADLSANKNHLEGLGRD